jgi:hypothetical protein
MTITNRQTFESALERVRINFDPCVYGYVVMPEHVHLSVGKPERKTLAHALKSPNEGLNGAPSFFKSGVLESLDLQRLLRQSLAVLFRPGAISRHCLQWRTALSPTGAGPFGLGFGHARAGLCVQAGTDVNHIALALLIA